MKIIKHTNKSELSLIFKIKTMISEDINYRAFSKLSVEEHCEYLRPYIKVVRYRYLTDPLSKRRPTYTMYELYIEDVMVLEAHSGYRFSRASQFKKRCEEKFNMDKDEIEILKTSRIDLQFTAQRI